MSCQERRVGKFFSQSNSVAENTKSTKSCKTLSDCHVIAYYKLYSVLGAVGRRKGSSVSMQQLSSF